jgi:hypothetical protein
MRHKVRGSTVRRLVIGLGYSRQFNRKTLEGGGHVDRKRRMIQMFWRVSLDRGPGREGLVNGDPRRGRTEEESTY